MFLLSYLKSSTQSVHIQNIELFSFRGFAIHQPRNVESVDTCAKPFTQNVFSKGMWTVLPSYRTLKGCGHGRKPVEHVAKRYKGLLITTPGVATLRPGANFLSRLRREAGATHAGGVLGD